MLSLSKAIVVVDEHVDVHDYEDVFFRVTANVDPERDVLITEGPLDHLDRARAAVLRRQARHRRRAQAARGGRQAWPEEIEMLAKSRSSSTAGGLVRSPPR